MPGKRKQIMTAWKAKRKEDLAKNRRKKAIRLAAKADDQKTES
jgi:hypothetical protein